MKYFILGVVVTLAVIYPEATKNLLGFGVDTVHNITTGAVANVKP